VQERGGAGDVDGIGIDGGWLGDAESLGQGVADLGSGPLHRRSTAKSLWSIGKRGH